MPDDSVRLALARRGRAARRLPPLQGRGSSTSLAAYDPALNYQELQPSAFGLSDAELQREASRLRAGGWASWEIAATLVRPAVAA